ncbi:N-acetyltransferase [Niallia circulans]|uniref:GNAT family N-acetyltransferase n=1 Tax=Niallia circulans TaxID=1397 RepID=UPI00397A6075
MKYIRADRTCFDPRLDMSRIFVEGWFQWLKQLTKDKEKLVRAFAHCFVLENYYVAVADDEVASFVAVTDRKSPFMVLDKKILRREMGLLRGTIAYGVVNKYLANPVYPFSLESGTGSFDIVGTAPKFRGQGIGRDLMLEAIKDRDYGKYVIETYDTNHSAIRLYEKVGFREFKRLPEKNKRAGFDYAVYLGLEVD